MPSALRRHRQRGAKVFEIRRAVNFVLGFLFLIYALCGNPTGTGFTMLNSS
jgi:cytochrome c oxidase assembly factor CtaG